MSMQLSDHDIGSGLWLKLVEWQQARLARLRCELEQDKDLVATAKLRGRIAEINVFLRAGEPAREVVVDAE